MTDEHLPIHPDLLGAELATPRRRAVAILCDILLCGFVVGPWVMLWAALALHLQAPSVLPGAWRLVTETPVEAEAEVLKDEIWRDLADMAAQRRPDLIPPEGHEALDRGDYEQLSEILTVRSNVNLQLGEAGRSYYDRQKDTYHLKGDIIFGPAAQIFGGLSGIMLYFSLLTWRGRGKTPGKWFWGIAVRRLDGKRLTLWDAFGRAGGYSSSLSTVGLGFFDAIWHPNRQTTHDRISGTVVIRLEGESFLERARNLLRKIFGRWVTRLQTSGEVETFDGEEAAQHEESCDEPTVDDLRDERPCPDAFDPPEPVEP